METRKFSHSWDNGPMVVNFLWEIGHSNHHGNSLRSMMIIMWHDHAVTRSMTSRARDVIAYVASCATSLWRQTDRGRSAEYAKFRIFQIGPLLAEIWPFSWKHVKQAGLVYFSPHVLMHSVLLCIALRLFVSLSFQQSVFFLWAAYDIIDPNPKNVVQICKSVRNIGWSLICLLSK